jgi:AcrR family transcriptional regulator
MAVSPQRENRDRIAEPPAAATGPLFDRSARGRLLTAAAVVATHGGYRDATVERLLEHARVGWAEFTAEFESLEDCFLAAQSAAMDCAATQAELAVRAVAPDPRPEAAFDAALTALLETMAAHIELAKLALVESTSLGAKGIERKEAGLQRFVSLLQSVAGGPEGGPPPIAAEMVAGGIYEILQRKVAAGEVDGLPRVAGELSRLWLPLIGSGGPRK